MPKNTYKIKTELSIVMPFYNEEENVEKVCEDLSREFARENINYEIVAVNNGSFDKTPELLDKIVKKIPQVKIITVKVNQGFGWGVIQGLNMASGEYIGYMAGDGQVSPSDVMRVFKKIKNENWDFGQGRRVKRNDGLIRKVSSLGFKSIFHLLFKSQIYDIGGHPKIIKRSLYEKIRPVSKDWFLDSEIILKSSYLTNNVGEVPLTFKKREKGRSNIKIRTVSEMLKNMIKWKIKMIKGKAGFAK